jgi:hypothetical protein
VISLGSSKWTSSSPSITLTFEYEKQRSGADMQYRAKITVSTVSGSSYFGYPIYLKLSIGGTQRVTKTLKNASPSQWTSAITYTSPWYTVSNKTTGTTPISFNVYSGQGSSRTATYSYNMAVDPAVSKISATNGTLGTALTLNLTRYNTSFTDTITYKCGTASGTIVSGSVVTSVTWNTTNGNTLNLAGQNTSGQSVEVTFIVTTYSGSTAVGTSSTKVTMTIPDTVKPSAALSVSDAAGYLSTYGAYVQGYSKLRIVVGTTAAYGSAIKTYSVTADGSAYHTQTVTTPALRGKGTLTVTANVSDFRSRSSDTVTKDITVLEYAKPSVTVVAHRCNSSGTVDSEGAYMRIQVISKISSLNGKNTATCKVVYPGGTLTGSANYTSSILACDVASTHNIEVTVTDRLSSTTKAAVIPIAYTLMDYYNTGRGVSFGKVATRDGFDCAMPAYFTGATELPSGVKVGGKTVDDYVVEHGTSGIWTYRKWASGIAECWGTSDTVTMDSWKEWGGMYTAANVIPSYNYPVQFTSAPMLQITYRAIKNGGLHYVEATGTAAHTPTVSVMRGTVGNGSQGCVHLYAIGKLS